MVTTRRRVTGGPGKDYCLAKEGAATIGVSYQRVLDLVQKNQITHVRHDGHQYVLRSEVEARREARERMLRDEPARKARREMALRKELARLEAERLEAEQLAARNGG